MLSEGGHNEGQQLQGACSRGWEPGRHREGESGAWEGALGGFQGLGRVGGLPEAWEGRGASRVCKGGSGGFQGPGRESQRAPRAWKGGSGGFQGPGGVEVFWSLGGRFRGLRGPGREGRGLLGSGREIQGAVREWNGGSGGFRGLGGRARGLGGEQRDGARLLLGIPRARSSVWPVESGATCRAPRGCSGLPARPGNRGIPHQT